MKAVIMAGGEGSRLRPLTCDRPKPMVPLMNKPTMEHIVKLLESYGITDIGVTLQYMPEAIMDYFGDGKQFGVNLKYFIEEEPLGTAGSVKNGEEFLDETFLVISGDALTDFDLQRAINFHKEKEALATLVLTTVENPLEYGVVITKPTGEIGRFLEKPSWGEVFSDTVNTGIYILEPEVLSYFPANTKYDFSKDLFPKLLAENKALYGCVLEGYWCDIGDLQQYQQAHFDILDRKVKIGFTAKELRPGVWVEEDVMIHPEATIKAPAYIGTGTKIEQGAKVGAYSVIGENNVLYPKASIKKSVLWNHNRLDREVQVRGTTICHKVHLQKRSNIFEGAVIGDATIVEAGATVRPGVKIWPYKTINSGAIVNDSLIWGTKAARNLFGLKGIRGILNHDLTPEAASKLGSAYGSMINGKGSIVISCDDWPGAGVIKQSIMAGLQASGLKVCDIGRGVTSVNRFAIKNLTASGGVHVKQCPEDSDKISIQLFNNRGANISKGDERKLENLLAREDFKRSSQVGQVEYVADIIPNYCNNVLSDCFGLEKKSFSQNILVGYQGKIMGDIISKIFENSSCKIIISDFAGAQCRGHEIKNLAQSFSSQVRFNCADLGVFFDNNGEHLTLFDEFGREINDDELAVINSLITLETKPGTELALPTTAPHVIEKLAESLKGQVIRTKTAPQILMDKMDDFQFNISFDAMFNLASILKYMNAKNITLSQLRESIPKFYTYQNNIYCPWEAKGKVLRKIIEECEGQKLEMLDGVKVIHDSGWSLLLPDSEKPYIRVYSEGLNPHEAKLLNEMYCDKIETLKV